MKIFNQMDMFFKGKNVAWRRYSLKVGQVVKGNRGKYEVIRKLGGGGMGYVYLAKNLEGNQELCAIKEIIDYYSDPEEKDRIAREFRREAKLLKNLNFRSIPKIYDSFEEDDFYYIVMEYVKGLDLHRIMTLLNKPFSEPRVIKLMVQVCDVLHYLHTQRPPVIYRDLKPSNIMVTENDRIYLVDFGIARFLSSNLTNLTTVGTSGYAPPELYKEHLEPASDLYSLGATIFYLLTNVSPQKLPIAIFNFEKHPLPREYNSKITPEMEKLIMKCVEMLPQNRFSSARAVKKELEKIWKKYYRDYVFENDLLTIVKTIDESGEAKALVENPLESEKIVKHHHLKELVKEVEENLDEFLPNEKFLEKQGSEKVSYYCSKCMFPISENDLICPNCGARQPNSPFIKIPRATLKLKDSNVFFNIVKEITTIGRKDEEKRYFPDIDLSEYDKGRHVSRLHARIIRLNEDFYIEDLKSKNKVVVNNKYVLQHGVTYKLKDGDVVKIGKLEFIFKK